eukprot:TRINITY_DN6495_c0_g1_i1.p1 TRINITY_DN6495_c0_g1~~TRINITY_DN6495_c0_g1_i1.p1  ORF type:complete len:557 (-),score=70.44 TRINITY_DN6495_c0_g1_i1:65-1735(-)
MSSGPNKRELFVDYFLLKRKIKKPWNQIDVSPRSGSALKIHYAAKNSFLVHPLIGLPLGCSASTSGPILFSKLDENDQRKFYCALATSVGITKALFYPLDYARTIMQLEVNPLVRERAPRPKFYGYWSMVDRMRKQGCNWKTFFQGISFGVSHTISFNVSFSFFSQYFHQKSLQMKARNPQADLREKEILDFASAQKQEWKNRITESKLLKQPSDDEDFEEEEETRGEEEDALLEGDSRKNSDSSFASEHLEVTSFPRWFLELTTDYIEHSSLFGRVRRFFNEMDYRTPAVIVASVVCSSLVSYPLDFLATQRAMHYHLTTEEFFYQMRYFYGEFGMKGFFKGLSTSIVHNSLFCFGVFYPMKKLHDLADGNVSSKSFFLSYFFTSIILHALEVVKVRKQGSSSIPGFISPAFYAASPYQCIKDLWRGDRFHGLLRGYWINFYKFLPTYILQYHLFYSFLLTSSDPSGPFDFVNAVKFLFSWTLTSKSSIEKKANEACPPEPRPWTITKKIFHSTQNSVNTFIHPTYSVYNFDDPVDPSPQTRLPDANNLTNNNKH